MQKICTKCNYSLDLYLFSFRNKKQNIRNNWCKSCIKTYDQIRHQGNSEYRLIQSRNRRHNLRTWIDELKSSLKCSNCPENHIGCLHFHHTNPSEKDDTIGNALRIGWGKERILKEIQKCIVLCANCHSKLHYNERYGLE